MRETVELSKREQYWLAHIRAFRKGINGLSIRVEETLNLNPFSESLFVFSNRCRNRIKILY